MQPELPKPLSQHDFDRYCQELLSGKIDTPTQEHAMREYGRMQARCNAYEAQESNLVAQLRQCRQQKLKMQGAMDYVLDQAVSSKHTEAHKATPVVPSIEGATPAQGATS